MSEPDCTDEASEFDSEGGDQEEDEALDSRQQRLEEYESRYDCRVIVVDAEILTPSAVNIEDILLETGDCESLHLFLNTLGGEGEAAIRLVRQMRTRCTHLTVIVPLEAKSAGTLLLLGADEIVTGPTSDLGPIDPQLWLEHYGRKPAKTVLEAFRRAEAAAATEGVLASFHAMTLENRSAFEAQEARESLDHATLQLEQSLANCPSRKREEISDLTMHLERVLIQAPQVHEASIYPEELLEAGLPIVRLSHQDQQWIDIWAIWIMYTQVSENQVYESTDVSFRFYIDPSD